jgi:TonB family protein
VILNVTNVIFIISVVLSKLEFLKPMRHWIGLTLLAVCWTLVGVHSSFAQQDDSDANRKVVTRVMPEYPAMAKTMGLRGSVRVEVLVAPNGTVKSLQIKGGHPVLAQAAADAVRKWKWVQAAHETKEPVVVKFDPEN